MKGVAAFLFWLASAVVVHGQEVVVRSGEHGGFSRLALTFPEPPVWRLGRVQNGYELRQDGQIYPFDLTETFNRIGRERIADLTADDSTGSLVITLSCPCHARAFVESQSILVIDIYPGAPPAGSPFETSLGLAPGSQALGAVEPVAAPKPEAASAAASLLANLSRPAVLGPLVGPAVPPPVPQRGAALPDAEVLPGATSLPQVQQAVTRVDGRAMPSVKEPLGAMPLRAPLPPGVPTLERFAEVLGPQFDTEADAEPSMAEPDPVMPDPSDAPPQAETPQHVDVATQPQPGNPSAAPPIASVGLPDPRLISLQDQLLRGLGEAVARGAIEVDQPVGVPEMRALARPALQDAAPSAAIDTQVPEAASQMALRRNGIDPTHDRASNGGPCIPDEDLDLAGWSDPQTLTDAIARHRGQLVGEFDIPRPDAVADLVRTYLGAGFGAEARAVLASFAPALDPKALPDAPLFDALGHLVDGDPPPMPHAFEGMAVCDGNAALWAALATRDLGPGAQVDANAIERAFAGLPAHLRGFLGPDLAARMLAAGQDATAYNLRESLARVVAAPEAGPQPEVALGMVDARLDMHAGRHAQAEAGLRDIAGANSPLAIDAMIEMVDSRIARGKSLTTADLLALSALAREHRGGPDGDGLRRAEALATAAAGDYARVFEALVPPGDRVRAEIWTLLADRGPDAALIEQAVPQAVRARAEAPATVRHNLADRLLGLGFIEPAFQWLGNDAGPPARLLRARGELARAAPEAAIAHLAGMQDAEATFLRAEALLAMGQAGAAAQIFADLGQPARSQQAALQAGALDKVLAGPDARLSALVAPLIARQPQPDGAGPASMPATLDAGGPTASDTVPPEPEDLASENTRPPATMQPEPSPMAIAPPTLAAAGDDSAPLAAGRALLAASERERGMLDQLLRPAPEGKPQPGADE